MIRNKSFSNLVFLLLFLTIAGAAIVCAIDVFAGFTALLFFLIMDAVFLFYTKQRYDSIKKLSEYFYKIYSGGEISDVQDYTEGELSILKDDILKMTVALQEKNDLLKKDKNYLTETLSNISHQLKTPLTSMFMMADLMSEPELPQEKREEFLNNLINQLKRIEWLVTSLLKLSRIDAEAVEFKREKTTMPELVLKAIEPLQIPIEIKNINIQIISENSINMILDINWTVEAILNIIKNCIEHTPEGGIIQIECKDTSVYALLIIKDDGEGIASEDMPHIFKRFYKGKNAEADSVGIGLAMAKTILTNQNAKVELSSKEGEGSEFRIKFYK